MHHGTRECLLEELKVPCAEKKRYWSLEEVTDKTSPMASEGVNRPGSGQSVTLQTHVKLSCP